MQLIRLMQKLLLQTQMYFWAYFDVFGLLSNLGIFNLLPFGQFNDWDYFYLTFYLLLSNFGYLWRFKLDRWICCHGNFKKTIHCCKIVFVSSHAYSKSHMLTHSTSDLTLSRSNNLLLVNRSIMLVLYLHLLLKLTVSLK